MSNKKIDYNSLSERVDEIISNISDEEIRSWTEHDRIKIEEETKPKNQTDDSKTTPDKG